MSGMRTAEGDSSVTDYEASSHHHSSALHYRGGAATQNRASLSCPANEATMAESQPGMIKRHKFARHGRRKGPFLDYGGRRMQVAVVGLLIIVVVGSLAFVGNIGVVHLWVNRTHPRHIRRGGGHEHARHQKYDGETIATFSKEMEDSPLVHIVNTRFMQAQPHLETLAQARLELFRTFCLPTMVHQSTQNFVWLIKTDPDLDINIRRQMEALLQPYPNFFLIGTNRNFLIANQIEGGQGAWRGGIEGQDVLEAPIYTGHVPLLQRAHDSEHSKIVLQTRLDADDGLTDGYLQHVQTTALEIFSSPTPPNWMYWCSRRHIEWFADQTIAEGRVTYVQHSKLCITPGITVGFPVGTSVDHVPLYPHDELYKAIERKGGCLEDDSSTTTRKSDLSTNNMECIHLVDAFPMVAIRSRTPTSAGMMGLDSEQRLAAQTTLKLWNILQGRFFVQKQDTIHVNHFVQTNLKKIAIDNLKGQCTDGHSCKTSSKELLEKLLKEADEEE